MEKLLTQKLNALKVLWFTNTPCSAVEKSGMNLNSGGWLRSLEEELNKVPEVELAICFYSYQYLEPFKFNGTQFYPVFRKGKKNKISRLIKRIFSAGNDDEREIKELLKVIELFKPNLIHVHGTEDNFGMVQYSTNIPVVISIQGILNSIAEKYFSGIPYSIVSCHESVLYKLAAASIGHDFRQLKKYAERERRILMNAKYIIGRTDLDRRITSVLAPESMYFVGNEILRSQFYENIWSKKQFGETIQIVTISNSALYKGLETIVSTAQILKENTDLKFVWKVIGLSGVSNIVKIVKKWKGLNFQNLNIQLLGSQNEKDIIETLLRSDIYCQTSHIDNSPNSLCEAMILGMPVIATVAGGTSSLLKDKEEGILIQDGDPYSLAGAIIELSGNFPKAREYGNAAYTRALQRHNGEFVKEEYLKIYKIITARGREKISK